MKRIVTTPASQQIQGEEAKNSFSISIQINDYFEMFNLDMFLMCIVSVVLVTSVVSISFIIQLTRFIACVLQLQQTSFIHFLSFHISIYLMKVNTRSY